MARKNSDAEIWEAVKRAHPPASGVPNGNGLSEALIIAAVSDLLGIEPDRVRDVIAMRATTIGVG